MKTALITIVYTVINILFRIEQPCPQAMDMKVVSVEFNSGVSDDVFKVE